MSATDMLAPAGRTAAESARRRRIAGLARAAALYLAPTAALLLVLVAWPLFNVVWQSLHYVNLVDPFTTGFAGLENFRTVLDDGDFLPALANTLTWTVLSVAGEYALGLASALALAQPVRGRSVFRGIVVVP